MESVLFTFAFMKSYPSPKAKRDLTACTSISYCHYFYQERSISKVKRVSTYTKSVNLHTKSVDLHKECRHTERVSTYTRKSHEFTVELLCRREREEEDRQKQKVMDMTAEAARLADERIEKAKEK